MPPLDSQTLRSEVGIGVETGESQEAGIVFLGLRDAIDQRAEFERDDLNVHAELLQIVLNKRGHFGAVGV